MRVHIYLALLGVILPSLLFGQKVVFIGNSITAGWDLAAYFPEKDYVNKGMSGQITSQFLERYDEDVLKAKPVAVVILGGINDISRSIDIDTVFKNIVKMAVAADASNIKVVVSSVLPVSAYACCDGFSARPLILSLNEKLEKFARAMGFQYLDYYTSLVDECGGLTDRFTFDGVHLTKEGYEVMTGIATEVLTHMTNGM